MHELASKLAITARPVENPDSSIYMHIMHGNEILFAIGKLLDEDRLPKRLYVWNGHHITNNDALTSENAIHWEPCGTKNRTQSDVNDAFVNCVWTAINRALRLLVFDALRPGRWQRHTS